MLDRIAALLVAILLAAGAGFVVPTPAASGAREDGRDPQPRVFAPGTQPRVFAPGTISTDREEYRVSFAPNGRTAYFARSRQFFPFERKSTIMVSRYRTGEWTAPKVARFSGTYPDIDPFVTADGLALYFSSIRPGAGTVADDIDLWVVRRQPGAGWGKPQHLGAANSSSDDLYPSVSANGMVYFGSDRPGGEGGFDVWRSKLDVETGAQRKPVNLGRPVNTAGWEFNPVVVLGQALLVFTRIEDPTALQPFGDLHVSLSLGDGWTQPRGIDAVNTDDDEFHPSFSPDLRKFYFVRRSPLAEDAQGDVYTLPTWRLLR